MAFKSIDAAIQGIQNRLGQLDTAIRAAVTQISAYAVPPGAIVSTGAATAPAGWMLCQGQMLTTAAQPALFNAIGYTFGGSGSTFYLPNLKGRVVVGVDAAQTEFSAVAKTGGAKTHLLTANESGLREHRHEIRGAAGGVINSYDDGYLRSSGNSGGIDASFRTGGIKNHSGGSGSNGWNSGGIAQDAVSAHNNLQPFMALNYLIRL